MGKTITLHVARQKQASPIKMYIGWRGLHAETEGGRKPAYVGAPAVIPDYYPVALLMTKDIQLMSFDLMRHFCSAITPERWRILHGYRTAMNNFPQNGFDGGTPHADFVNGLDLMASLPRYDKCRTFQGSFITGRLEGSLIWCQPGVDGIDARSFRYVPGTLAAAETLKQIIDRHWYSIAICTGDPPFHFRSQWGSGCMIAYPFIMDRLVAFEARFFAPWNETFLPDPLKSYVED